MHSKAYIFSQTGGPEVLAWSDVELGDPTDKEVLVQHSAIGVNYIDIYHRKGVYPLPMPSGLGVEGAGIILAVGRGVTHLTVGDRVVYAGGPPGAYSDKRLLPAARVVRIPDGIDFETAASTFFKGLTAGYLITQTFRVQAGQNVLFLAAAGGVGSIAVQWLKHIGARVIAVVGSEEKSALVKTLGADDVLVNTDGDFASAVRKLVPEGLTSFTIPWARRHFSVLSTVLRPAECLSVLATRLDRYRRMMGRYLARKAHCILPGRQSPITWRRTMSSWPEARNFSS
jgi:NADPH2:quinone reductase